MSTAAWESTEQPIQVKDAEKIGYLPATTPMTGIPVVYTTYFHGGKWWDADWYGLWFVQEHVAIEGEVIYGSEDEAMTAAKG